MEIMGLGWLLFCGLCLLHRSRPFFSFQDRAELQKSSAAENERRGARALRLRLSKKPSAGVSRPQARNKIASFFPRRVRGKNTLRGASVELCATGTQPRRRAKRSPSQKSGSTAFLTCRRGPSGLFCISQPRVGSLTTGPTPRPWADQRLKRRISPSSTGQTRQRRPPRPPDRPG